MTTVQPAGPETAAHPPVRASALAAWQLVEDARNRTGRRPHDLRSRVLAQRTVADRRAERAHSVD